MWYSSQGMVDGVVMVTSDMVCSLISVLLNLMVLNALRNRQEYFLLDLKSKGTSLELTLILCLPHLVDFTKYVEKHCKFELGKKRKNHTLKRIKN